MLHNKNMVGKVLCGHERRVLRHRQVAIASRMARSESDQSSKTPDFARIKMFNIITAPLLPPHLKKRTIKTFKAITLNKKVGSSAVCLLLVWGFNPVMFCSDDLFLITCVECL